MQENLVAFLKRTAQRKGKMLSEKHFSKNYINIGAGRIINLDDLFTVQDA